MSLSNHFIDDGMEASLPFLFNSLKHHSGRIQTYIKLARDKSFDDAKIATDLLKVGNSIIDIYHGSLSIHQITHEIKDYLESIDCFEASQYQGFIAGYSKNFRTVDLCDGSNWTLITGDDPGRYLHIHPSRASLHTIRARAIALKTAIYIMVFYDMELANSSLVELTNEVRVNLMKESPIKNEVYTRSVSRVLGILRY